MEGPSSADAYDQILKLERNLLAASKSKGSFDPAIRRLRTSIRDGYESLILRDLTFCEAFEVEQAVWRLHYREIEGFRLRIRKLLIDLGQTEGHVPRVDHHKKRKRENKKEPLLRVVTSFRSFLGEASGFFHSLLIKLRLQHGLASSLGNADRISAEADIKEELRRCMATCNRILVYLGDLSRYKELYAVIDSSERDWSVAANYYKQAAVLWPSSGNPYNQNKLIAAQISASGTDIDERFKGEITLPTNLHGFVIEQDLWSIRKVARSEGGFIILFIELVRSLLSQSSADELDKAVAAIEGKQEQFLCESMNDAKISKLACSLPVALQMLTVLIFCMHHIMRQPGLNGEHVSSSILRFTLKFFTQMAKMAQGKLWSAFPVNVILMEWLVSQNKLLQQTFCVEAAMGPIFSDFWERVIALDSSFLKKNMVNDVGCNMEMFQQDQMSGIAGKAQWEDHELLGFVPLADVHLRLDFSSQLSGYANFNLATHSAWRFRCTQALQKLWNVVGQNSRGGLMKIPDLSHAISGTEESNPTPSLKEWIEKTFFSSDLSSNSACPKQTEVLSSKKEAHLQKDVISTAHGLEHADTCEFVGPTISKANVESVQKATTDIIARCSYLEQDEDMKVLEEQKVLATTAGLIEEMSSTKVNSVDVINAVNVNSRQEICELGCRAKLSDTLISDFPHGSWADSSFKHVAGDFQWEFRERRGGVASHFHGQQQVSPISCFDSFSHVKPEGLKDSFSRRHLCMRLNRQLGLDSKVYETQNPFVQRLWHLSKKEVPP